MKSFMRKIRRSAKSLGRSQKGFTLIEVLVVVAILGVLAAVAVPQVSKFIGSGDDSAAEVELRDVQTAVTALLADTNSAELDNAVTTATGDMTQFKVGTATAADYMTGLEAGSVKSGHTYTATLDGEVTQVS